MSLRLDTTATDWGLRDTVTSTGRSLAKKSSKEKNERDGWLAVPLLFQKSCSSGLESLDVLSLPALGSLDHVELNLLAFLK